MGEVAAGGQAAVAADRQRADGSSRVGEPFKLEVSTRNLVRDRFLGAAAGGYYLESSFLHDGPACSAGTSTPPAGSCPRPAEAPDSARAPEFFLATQDNGGGANADTVTVNVPGIKTAGVLQCTSWAGDGSHRTPMMSRANQTPAIDSVRITVGGNGEVRAPTRPRPADAAAQRRTGSRSEAGRARPTAAKQAAGRAGRGRRQAPDQAARCSGPTGAGSGRRTDGSGGEPIGSRGAGGKASPATDVRAGRQDAARPTGAP